MKANEGKFFRQNLLRRTSIRKCLDQISLSDAPKLSSLMLSLMLETGWHVSLPLKVFRIESRDAIPLRGEGCNTPGVCHQLSNGFELKHSMLSDDEDGKVKPMERSHHLNLDHAPLLTCCPFLKVCLSNAGCTHFMCLASISIYIDPWKSFVKFGIKKSHEMTSYVLAWIVL